MASATFPVVVAAFAGDDSKMEKPRAAAGRSYLAQLCASGVVYATVRESRNPVGVACLLASRDRSGVFTRRLPDVGIPGAPGSHHPPIHRRRPPRARRHGNRRSPHRESTGPAEPASKTWQVNRGRGIAINIAADLAAWNRLLGFGDEEQLRDADLETLRYHPARTSLTRTINPSNTRGGTTRRGRNRCGPGHPGPHHTTALESKRTAGSKPGISTISNRTSEDLNDCV
jgi:hypothetical protein